MCKKCPYCSSTNIEIATGEIAKEMLEKKKIELSKVGIIDFLGSFFNGPLGAVAPGIVGSCIRSFDDLKCYHCNNENCGRYFVDV